jgi:hypothetical protein
MYSRVCANTNKYIMVELLKSALDTKDFQTAIIGDAFKVRIESDYEDFYVVSKNKVTSQV